LAKAAAMRDAANQSVCLVGFKEYSMAQFQFIEDYERHVRKLKARYPIDQAMNLAVGGNYDEIGKTELEIVRFAGLCNGMHLLDLGCGSGRLASKVGADLDIAYLDIDVVQALLDHAKANSPPHFRLLRNCTLSIPLSDDSVDTICAFSLFTPLLHAETFLYLEECRRVLKPDGLPTSLKRSAT
jgi:ubiquinone/menaquinone biosynthesis C-methylase UbiE